MKKNNININNLVRKVIEESLQEKADELTNKVKSKMDEWNPNEPVNISGQDTDMHEEDDMDNDYVMDKIKRECEENPRSESCRKHKEYAGVDSEIGETLYGGQKKLDKNKNGKLDKEDFEMLRGEKNEEDEFDYMDDEDEFEMPPVRKKTSDDKFSAFDKVKRGQEPEDIGWEEIEDEEDDDDYGMEMSDNTGFDSEMEEGNAFTDALRKTKKGDKFELGGKSYTDRSNLDEAEKFIKKAIKKMEKKGTEGSFKEYCGGEVTKSCIDKAMKSGDPKLVKKANFAKNIKAYHGAEHKKKSVKESLQLTETEMIDLIEKIVSEETKNRGVKPKGLAQTEKVLSANKKENDDYIKSVTKKMKEYLKDGSKGEYSMEPKIFPKGNGELAKMDKKAYIPSVAVDEYIDAFSHPGQTNLVYDEIKPDDEKIKKYLKGDSTTGNSQKYANAVETEVGEKFYKNYENNMYGAEQMDASYKRQPQPVDIAGETKPKNKLSSIRGKKAAKAQKVLDKVNEDTSKKDILISEEFGRIKNLMGYSSKTQ